MDGYFLNSHTTLYFSSIKVQVRVVRGKEWGKNEFENKIKFDELFVLKFSFFSKCSSSDRWADHVETLVREDPGKVHQSRNPRFLFPFRSTFSWVARDTRDKSFKPGVTLGIVFWSQFVVKSLANHYLFYSQIFRVLTDKFHQICFPFFSWIYQNIQLHNRPFKLIEYNSNIRLRSWFFLLTTKIFISRLCISLQGKSEIMMILEGFMSRDVFSKLFYSAGENDA